VGQWKVLRKQEGIDKDWPDGLRATVDKEYMRICELTLEVERKVLAHIAHFFKGDFSTWQINFGSQVGSLAPGKGTDRSDGSAPWYRKLKTETFGAQNIIEPLLRNSLLLGPDLNFEYLTCAEVRREDYPWDSDEETWKFFQITALSTT
jgi:hypothetical protein